MSDSFSINDAVRITSDRRLLEDAMTRLKRNLIPIDETVTAICGKMADAVGSSVVIQRVLTSPNEIVPCLQELLRYDESDARAFCEGNDNLSYRQTIASFEVATSPFIKGVILSGEFSPRSSDTHGKAIYCIAFLVSLSSGEFAAIVPSEATDS